MKKNAPIATPKSQKEKTTALPAVQELHGFGTPVGWSCLEECGGEGE